MPTASKKKHAPAAAPPPLPRFAKWIDSHGVVQVATDLGVSRFAVYGWRRGAVNLAAGEDASTRGGTQPAPDKLGAIIALAAGQLTAADIYPSKRATT